MTGTEYAAIMILAYFIAKVHLFDIDEKFTAGWLFVVLFWPLCLPVLIVMMIVRLRS